MGRRHSAQLFHGGGAGTVLSDRAEPTPAPSACRNSLGFHPRAAKEMLWSNQRHHPLPWDGSVGPCITASLVGNCRIRTSGFEHLRETSASGAKHCLAVQRCSETLVWISPWERTCLGDGTLAEPVKCSFSWVCGTLRKIPLIWDLFLGFSMLGQPEISQGLNLK